MASNQFNYGGQAVIEGVMMRGSRHMAVAVRDLDGGIVFHEQELNSPLYNGWMSKVPFLRGLGLLWDSMGLGIRALMFSADVSVGDDADFAGPVAWGTVAVSMTIGVALFMLVPAAVGEWLHTFIENILSNSIGFLSSPVIGNLIEGFIRMIIVIGYIWLIGFMPDVKRLCKYHGAEHKTINAYEAGDQLTIESIARYPLEHPRCGTGFLLVVVIISIVVTSLFGRPPLLIRLASRIVLIPVIAAIAYEYIKFLAKHLENPLVKVLIWPQLALQKLTTDEPEAEMIEVALMAFQKVMATEQETRAETLSSVPVGAEG